MRFLLYGSVVGLASATLSISAAAQIDPAELYPFPSVTQQRLDFDADRFLDLAFLEAGALRLARNTGDGGFYPPLSIPVALDGALVAVRANADTERDLLILSSSAPLAQSWMRTATAGVLLAGPVFPVPVPIASGANAIHVADLDRDGLEDVLRGNASLLSNGDGTFRSRPEAGIAGGGARVLKDLDADGWLDAISLDPASPSAAPLLAFGSAQGFPFGQPLPLPATCTSGPASFDLDRDGILDIVCGGSTAAYLAFGLGGRQFTSFQSVAMAGADGPIAHGDFDGDGLLDIAFGARQRLTQVLRNLGSRRFVSLPVAGPSDPQGELLIAIDLDEDGRSELVGGEAQSLSILWSQGNFAFMPDRRVGLPVEQIAALDLDRDGDLDLLVAGGSGSSAHTQVLRNRLDPAFETYGTETPGTGGIGPSLRARGGLARAGNLNFGLRIDQALGRTAGIIVLGTDPTAIALPDGATLYVLPPFELELPLSLGGRAGVAGDGFGQLPLPLPLEAALVSTDVFAQAVLLDPGRSSALSFTAGLRVRLIP